MRVHRHGHRQRVPGLHEDRTRAAELTDQALTGRDVADDASGRDTFEDVLAVPGNEVTVVYDVLLALSKLYT